MKDTIITEVNRRKKALLRQLKTLDAVAAKLGGSVVKKKRKAKAGAAPRKAKRTPAAERETAPATRGVRKGSGGGKDKTDAEVAEAKRRRLDELRKKKRTPPEAAS